MRQALLEIYDLCDEAIDRSDEDLESASHLMIYIPIGLFHKLRKLSEGCKDHVIIAQTRDDENNLIFICTICGKKIKDPGMKL